jgi:3-deoxy-manno-octulosonate cytidylyltransferase (CMP-KDO synthetase)
MKTIIVIPARYKSSRYPGKPLTKLFGKPMVQWVAELSARAVGQNNVYIATENKKIFNTIVKAGFRSVMTSKNCLTGTDRLSEVAKKIKADIYINVQGDEPLIDPKDIIKIIDTKKKYPDDIINSYTVIKKGENENNINIPKVIFSENNHLIYISRKAIPGFKEKKNKPSVYYKQVCVYAYNRKELLKYGNFGRKSKLEKVEDIEILRFLEWGKTIRLIKTNSNSLAVDEPKDVKKVEIELKKLWEK